MLTCRLKGFCIVNAYLRHYLFLNGDPFNPTTVLSVTNCSVIEFEGFFTKDDIYINCILIYFNFQPGDADIVDRFISCARQAIPYFVVSS